MLENTAGLRNSCCLEPISLFRNVGHFAPKTSESAPFGEPAQPERPRLSEFPSRVGIRHSLRVRLGLPPPRLDPVSRTANHETFREVVVGPTEVGRVIDVTSLRMTSTLPHPGFGDRTYKLSSPPLELDPPSMRKIDKVAREIMYPMGSFAKPPATVTIYFSISSIE